MKPQDIANQLKKRFGDAILVTEMDVPDPCCQIEASALADVALHCRDELGFNYLRCLSGVDYLDKKKTTDELGVIYHLGAIPD
ncbi:MAG: NADH-quinone oxidoreductase subunit C, partial [Planctomycetes bacterium]|nr:NADH-quinone oxidoreductase subunit C [Planctomycetota bacterium]